MRLTSLAPLLAIALILPGGPVEGQTTPVSPAEAAIAAAVTEHSELGTPATFTYANRPIIQLRALFLGRGPAERVLAARVVLDRIVSEGVTGPVTSRQIDTLVTINVGDHYVFTIMPADIDTLAGETQAGAAGRRHGRTRRRTPGHRAAGAADGAHGDRHRSPPRPGPDPSRFGSTGHHAGNGLEAQGALQGRHVARRLTHDFRWSHPRVQLRRSRTRSGREGI